MKTITRLTGIIFLILTISTTTNAQITQWAKHIGGADYDETATDLKTDAEGNLYLLGNSKGSVDFDPSESSQQLSSETFTPFIAKYSPDGELIWVGQIGCTQDNYSEASAMTLDENNNIFITGSFIGTVDFDLSFDDYELTSEDNNDMFVLKLNSDGEFVWAKAFDGALSGAAYPMDIAVKNSEIYVTGYFDYTIQFDASVAESEHQSNGEDDVFLLQLDNEGNYVWSYGAGSEDDDRALGIDLSDEGNVFITGYHEGTMDFGPGSISENVNGSGTFIVKYLDSSHTDFVDGNRLCDWTRSFGAMEGSNIVVDSEENVYVTGLFYGSVNFNPFNDFYLTAPSNPDIYIIKVSNSGFQWALTPWTYEINGGIFPEDLSLDDDGNLYITGQHSDDIFIKKYSPEGEQMYSTAFVVYGECDWANTGYGVVPADNNSYVLIADFENTLEFNINDESEFEITAYGGKDLVMIKHDTDEPQSIVSQSELNPSVYPNPAKEFINISQNNIPQNIQILGVDGRIYKTINNSNKIDISGLNSGFYFLKFELNNQVKSVKFIKE
jgi:hypothetical protein